MDAIINDLSFQYPYSSVEEAKNSIINLIDLCKRLESGDLTNLQEIRTAPVNIANTDLVPGIKLVSWLNKAGLEPDKKRYLLGLLVNRRKPELPNIPFCEIDNKISQIPAYVFFNNDFLVSLCTDIYKNFSVSGIIEGKKQTIKNLSSSDHIYEYRFDLGQRIYKGNDGKHKDTPVSMGKGKIASSRGILKDQDCAQKLLNKAQNISGHLCIKCQNDKNYYSFQCERDIYYHGYIDDSLPDNIKCILDRSAIEL